MIEMSTPEGQMRTLPPVERIDIGMELGNAARAMKSNAIRVESLLSHPYTTTLLVEEVRKHLLSIAREALALEDALPRVDGL